MINFIFIDTVLAGLFFVDKGQCAQYMTEATCLQTKSLDQVDTLCLWTPPCDDGFPSISCTFNSDVGSTFFASLVLTNVISVVTVPFDAFVDFMVENVRDYYVISKNERKRKSRHVPDMAMNQELKSWQHSNAFMLAARLEKMRVRLDSSLGDEVETLLAFEKSEKRWFKFEHDDTEHVERHFSVREWIDSIGHKLASHVVRNTEINESAGLRNRVKDARRRAADMEREMKALKSDAEKEIYLYQVCCIIIWYYVHCQRRSVFVYAALFDVILQWLSTTNCSHILCFHTK